MLERRPRHIGYLLSRWIKSVTGNARVTIDVRSFNFLVGPHETTISRVAVKARRDKKARFINKKDE